MWTPEEASLAAVGGMGHGGEATSQARKPPLQSIWFRFLCFCLSWLTLPTSLVDWSETSQHVLHRPPGSLWTIGNLSRAAPEGAREPVLDGIPVRQQRFQGLLGSYGLGNPLEFSGVSPLFSVENKGSFQEM